MTVNESDSVLLYCWAVGYPAPRITWSKETFGPGNSVIITLPSDVTEILIEGSGLGVVRAQIRLSPVQFQDGGVYKCRVTNTVPTTGSIVGMDSSTFSLTVQSKQVLHFIGLLSLHS